MIPIIKLRLKQFYNSYLKRFFNRNTITIQLIIILFVLGVFVGRAWADKPIEKVSKPEVFLEAKVRVSNKNLFDSTTTSTTTTTTKPIVLYKKPAKSTSTSTVPTPETNVPPVTQAPVADPGSVQQMIIDAANKYGLDPNRMLRIAKCESGFRADAVNTGYTAGGGHPSGIFQFIPSTWNNMSNKAGFGGASVFDAYSNVNVAAWAFSNGMSGQWACK